MLSSDVYNVRQTLNNCLTPQLLKKSFDFLPFRMTRNPVPISEYLYCSRPDVYWDFVHAYVTGIKEMLAVQFFVVQIFFHFRRINGIWHVLQFVTKVDG